MKTNRLPAWAKSVMQRMLGAVTAANLKELGYGGCVA
jgi:hypothetical protein